NNIMTKTGSKPGEKTIIDALFPAVEAMQKNTDNPKTALQAAYKAAAEGSESTRNMLPVHGRAAYYGEKGLGILDGGSVVGKLIFEALYNCFF
ncbi:MAG: DAK2 domain-containing protein, partial [Firmicutes bacterium]|nr:DAK2 domain-containing protein [Bacillota bacterium]